MPTYLGFLRAINLGARRKFAAGELRECLTNAGYGDVASHINTGNVRIRSPRRSVAKVREDLEQLFAADRGFEVPTVVFTPGDFADVADDTAELAAAYPRCRHYISLLQTTLTGEQRRAAEVPQADTVTMVVRPRSVHFLVDEAHGIGNVDITKLDKVVGVSTNRNAKVIGEVAAKWC